MAKQAVVRRELHGAKTGNCLRVAIALHEASIDFQPVQVDLRRGEQRTAAYLGLNPAGKVPVLLEYREDEEPVILAQSNAILLHICAQVPGRLLPETGTSLYPRAIERFLYFVTDVIAVSHSSFFLAREGYGPASLEMRRRAVDALLASDRFLNDGPFMSGASFGLADIAAVTIVRAHSDELLGQETPRFREWRESVSCRPAVTRGLDAFRQ